MKKPRPSRSVGRKRRAAGWTLLTLGVIVAAVWVASGWWWFQHYINQSSISLTRGRTSLSIGCLPSNASRSLIKLQRPGVDWLVWADEPTWDGWVVAYKDLSSQDKRSIGVEFMLWPITLLLWTPAALLLRSGILARRRAAKGLCAKCGYSLAGLAADAPCPECGKATSSFG